MMDSFFYILILVGGTILAYYIVFVIGPKIAPAGLGKIKWPSGVTFLIQFVFPSFLLGMLAPAVLKNINKMFNITKEIGESEYLSVITKTFENSENAGRLWSMISFFLFLIIFKYIVENMPDKPLGLGAFAIAVIVVVFAATGSSVLWDIVGDKIWLRSIEFLDSVFWETEPGVIIREWWFPDATRIPPS